MITEAELNKKMESGGVKTVIKDIGLPKEDTLNTVPTLEDYISFLETLRRIKKHVDSVPTLSAKNFLEQIVLYEDSTGSTCVYMEINDNWKKIYDSMWGILTDAQKTDLTDTGDSTLHYHATDRNSANFTGTDWTDLTDGEATSLHKHDIAEINITKKAGENIAIRDAVYIPSSEADDVVQSDYDGANKDDIWGVNWAAQSFKVTKDINITKVGMYCENDGGTGASTATLSIRSSLTGADLTFVNISTNDISGGIKEQEFAIPSYRLLAGVTYYFVVRVPGAGSTTQHILWYYKGSSVYADGERHTSGNSGSSWDNHATNDLGFTIAGNENFKVKIADAAAGEISENFIGLATEAIAEGSEGIIRCFGLLDGFTNLTPGKMYFLSATAGEITDSEPADSRLVGIAISDTQVLINIGE